MAKWIDSDISFVNQLLQNSEYYFIADKKEEMKLRLE
jgi:hypothetical protein